MANIRIDVYGGYENEEKPDPDHKYSWKQENFETPQDFAERVCQYILDMVEQLAVDGDDND